MTNKEKLQTLLNLFEARGIREQEILDLLSGCGTMLGKDTPPADLIFKRRAERLAQLLELQAARNLNLAGELRLL